MTIVLWRAGVAWLLAGAAAGVMAQPVVVPPTQDIVEALRPSATRGMAGSGVPPSLALAIEFEPNSSRVRPQSGPVLGNLVAALLAPELKANRFVIEGHSDPSGAEPASQRLSQDRADEVRLYLVALGVAPARLRAVGKGAAVAESRRVRVVTVE